MLNVLAEILKLGMGKTFIMGQYEVCSCTNVGIVL